MMITWLQCHISCPVLGLLTSLPQGKDLSMRLTGLGMEAFADDVTCCVEDDATYDGIRSSLACR